MKRQKGKTVKIPIECELPIHLLNQKKVINTSTLSRSNQTTLGILSRKTKALKWKRTCRLAGDKIRILYKTPKKLAIELPN